MKKFLKSNKRWIAFFLAFLLVATTCVTSSDAFLWATGEDEATTSEQAESGPVEEVVEMNVEEEETEETDVDSETEEVVDDEEQQVSEEDAEQESGENENDEQAPVDEEIPEEDVIEEEPELVEEADTYGYAVYYYYDGVEDESARVEEEGALGDAILASAEEEVVYDGKDYVLDHIENKDGKIGEDAEQNVVKVYYVLAEEAEIGTYSFELKTVLSDGGEAEVVSPKEDGRYEAGEEVSFIVTVKEGYKLADVAKQDGTKLNAETEQDSTYSYKVTISENTIVTVTFEKEAVEMPAQVLQAKAGNVSVTITAPEGVLPAGTTAKAVLVTSKSIAEAINDQVAEEGKEVVGFTAVDITLYDKDGNEIQPNGELKVTFNNVSVSDEAEEAAVFHVDPSKKTAEKIKNVDANADIVKFKADHFSIYAAAGLADVQEMAITGSKTINVGETITLTGTTAYDYNHWSVDRSDRASISSNGSTAQVTGKAVGSVVVTHTYRERWYSRTKIETFNLTVSSTQRVYVYLKLSIDEGTANAAGWEKNKDGWYTIGYVDVEGIDAASSYTNGSYANDTQRDKVIAAINAGGIKKHDSCTVSFNFNDVTWKGTVDNDRFGLKAVKDGAAGYEVSGYTWHMDGYLEIDQIVDCKLTVNYLYENGEQAHEPHEDTLRTGLKYRVESPVIKGYTASRTVVSGTVANGDITETVYYIKDDSQWNDVIYLPGADGVTGVPDGMEDVLVGETVTKSSAVPQRIGYQFAGWKTEDVTVTADGTFTMPAKDVVFTAQWTPSKDTKYTVGYYYQKTDGTYPETTSYSRENKGTTGTWAEATEEDKKPNTGIEGTYVFDERNPANKLKETIAADGSTVLKVYFKQQFTVTYDLDGGTSTSNELVYMGRDHGEKTPTIVNPEKAGYTFNGWNKPGGEVAATVTENVTYVAQWTANDDTAYKVEHYQQNLNDDGYTLAQTEDDKTGKTGTEVTAIPKDFGGFKYDESASAGTKSGIIKGDGNLVLKLYYTRNKHNVTYDYTGTLPNGASERPAGGEYKFGEKVPVAADATAPGYTFNGWKAVNVTPTDDNKFDMPDGDVNFKGSFTANRDTKYYVAYYLQDLDGIGYSEQISARKDKTGITDTDVVIEQEDIKEFEGFTYNPVDPKNVVKGTIEGDEDNPLVLKLYYTRNKNYTVVYTDGVDGEVVFPDKTFSPLKYGEATPTISAPVRTGYTFTGWSPAWQSTVTNEGATLDQETNNYVITYTAQWVENYSIKKELTSTPPEDDAHESGIYNVGDTLTYEITVTNNTGVDISNVVVGDQLQNARRKVVFIDLPAGVTVDSVDNTVTIATLPANGTVTLKCEYVITDADAALNTDLADTDPANAGIKNVAIARVDGEEPKETNPTDPALTEEMYTLIVQYRYTDGREAAGTVTEYHKAGERYTVSVPTIEGYTSNYVAVTGTMPDEDVVVTVLYSAPTTPGTTGGGGGGTTPTPPTPPTPDGPNPIVVPDIPVPAGAIQVVVPAAEPVLAGVDDEAVPLQGARQGAQIDVDEDGNVTVTPIDEEDIPLAGGKEGTWALINFALMNLAIFESIMLLIGYFVKTQDEEEEKRKLKKKGLFRIISLPIAIISLIVFILTEDITLQTAFVDKYTIVMLIIAIVQTVMVALSKKKYEDEEQQEV